MPITGTDDVSLKVLDSFKRGVKLKEIPSMFPISVDQAKRLSRYHKILERSKEHLNPQAFKKVQMIGLKVLYLASLFKEEDWEGLTDILSSISENTKRDDLPLLIKALQEKKERVAAIKQEVEMKLEFLQRREQELLLLEEDTNKLMKKVEEETQFLSKYPKNVQTFLIKHLGIYEDKLVLAKRLDSNWQRSLKKKAIIAYDEWNYIWYVNNLDKMVEEYINAAADVLLNDHLVNIEEIINHDDSEDDEATAVSTEWDLFFCPAKNQGFEEVFLGKD